MENLNLEIKGKILEFLKTCKTPGCSSSEIAKNIGHNRATVSKYLEIMKTYKLLQYNDIAQAKLWSVSEKSTKQKILVVDDDPHIVELIKLTLLQKDYQVVDASSGFDALEKVKSETPDLILLDCLMPGINGYEVCRKLKESALTQHIPVIMLFDKGEKEKLKDKVVGADYFMQKPFDPTELEAKINTIIRRGAKDHDLNPLTKLPGKDPFLKELKKQRAKKRRFSIYNFHLSGLKKFKLEYSFREGDEILKLFARMLKEKTNKDPSSFVAHLSNDEFVLVTDIRKIKSEIANSLRKIMPFFYGMKKPKTRIRLRVKSIPVSKLRNIKSIEKFLKKNNIL